MATFDPSSMSIEEILAACRNLDGEGGGAPAEESAPQPAAKPEAVAEETSAAEEPQPAASGPPAQIDPGKMSVADMLAAARGEKSGGAKPAAKAAPKAKVAPKATPKESPKAPAAFPEGPKDTASILAAARKAAKPGPMSKAEAAARQQDETDAAAVPKKPARPAPPMPERPAYVQATAPAAANDASDRRGFLASCTAVFFGSSLAVGMSSLIVTNVLWVLGLARFMFPNILTEPPTKFKVGFPDDFAPGQVATKFKAEFGVWIVRYVYQGIVQIYALQSVCTHLGCTPNWLEGEQKFKCPCHGSGFYKDGINFEGPAPRPLERYAIRLADDGQLEVDKSRRFFEEKGEWKDPASFVPV